MGGFVVKKIRVPSSPDGPNIEGEKSRSCGEAVKGAAM